MNVVDKDSVARLAEHHGWPSVSIFLPAHTLPRQAAQDRIRLKNLARDATERLIAEGMRHADAVKLLEPVRSITEDDSFWREPSRGLAVFVAPGSTTSLKLNAAAPEQLVVGDRFYLKPLMAVSSIDESFLVLALDKNLTRLFGGSRTSIEPISLGDVPMTFAEAMKYDEVGRSLSTHSTTGGRISSRGRQHEGSSYAGYGNSKDAETEQTERFARFVEDAVATAVSGMTTPMLLIASERLASSYRAVSSYPHIAGVWVSGSSDVLSPVQLQARALEALAPVFTSHLENALGVLRETEGSTLTSHDAAEIVVAASEGRVRTLFLAQEPGPFGVFDRDHHQVADVSDVPPHLMRESNTPTYDGAYGWDLGDLAAAETALHGGEVLYLGGLHAPVEGLAAIYRY